MSLAALALRLIAVKAITGRTLAEDRIFDSQIESIDSLVKRMPAPLVIVSVDDADSRGGEGEPPSLGQDETLTLLFETAVAGQVEVDSAGEPITIFAATSQGLEATLDVLWRQVSRALLATPTSAPWGDLFWQFVERMVRIEKRRGGGAEKGVRFASRFILLTLEPAAEPAHGEPVSGRWAALLAAMRGEDDLGELADALEREIEAPAGLADWRIEQAKLGVSDKAARWIGLGPFAAQESDEAAVGEEAAELVEVESDAEMALEAPESGEQDEQV
jgi:hypothetical protein